MALDIEKFRRMDPWMQDAIVDLVERVHRAEILNIQAKVGATVYYKTNIPDFTTETITINYRTRD